MPQANSIHSRFFDYLLTSNSPQMTGFRRWLFQPGMLFNAPETWWGEKKLRATPHEGLDLYCFADAAGQIKELDEQIKIPAAFAGKIVKTGNDFLGKSIFISHELFAEDGRQLYTAYGHTRPLAAIRAGQVVAAGEIIATLAAPSGKNTGIPGHLHITLAWVPKSMPSDRLNWQTLSADRSITLIDPWPRLSAPA